MLLGRALSRSAPLAGRRRAQCSVRRLISSQACSHQLRHLSSVRWISPSSRSSRGLNYGRPLVLVGGGIASSRSFSLWGTSSKKTGDSPSSTDLPAEASVDTAAVAQPTVENALPTPTAPTDVDFASISEIVNAQDILDMPENIGYLSALGLDFGWGPTSMVQWLLEHVHIYSGLGWGASIMATAVLIRCLLVYPQIRGLKFNAEMQQLRNDPRAKEAMQLVQQGFTEGDMEKRQRGQYLNKMLKEQYGVSNWGMAWSFGQIPFTFGLFRIINGMVHVPVPAMESAGFLWFTDLTATDPFYVLPAAGTALMIAALAVNTKYAPEQQRKMLKPMLYIFGAVGFFGTTFLSAAVNLMAVALGASTLITAVVLNNAVVRRAVGLPPHAPAVEPVKSSNQITYEAPRAGTSISQPGLKDRLNTNLNDMKKGLSEQLASYTGTYSGTEQEKAEKKRKNLIRKLEETRRQQEREEFERKYKRKP